MALYSVTDKVIRGTPTEALADLETYLETVTNTKTIRLITATGDNSFVTFLVLHDA